jgi:hypothetical protein
MQTWTREGCSFHLRENGCHWTVGSGWREKDGVHQGAYPEDTGDEPLNTEKNTKVSTGTYEYFRSAYKQEH